MYIDQLCSNSYTDGMKCVVVCSLIVIVGYVVVVTLVGKLCFVLFVVKFWDENILRYFVYMYFKMHTKYIIVFKKENPTEKYNKFSCCPDMHERQLS